VLLFDNPLSDISFSTYIPQLEARDVTVYTEDLPPSLCLVSTATYTEGDVILHPDKSGLCISPQL